MISHLLVYNALSNFERSLDYNFEQVEFMNTFLDSLSVLMWHNRWDSATWQIRLFVVLIKLVDRSLLPMLWAVIRDVYLLSKLTAN